MNRFFSRKYIALYTLLTVCLSGNIKVSAQTDSLPAINLQQQLPTDDAWWNLFGDSVLDTLIQKTVSNNYDLFNAVNNILIAKSKLRIQQSGFYPSISLDAGWMPQKTSKGIEGTDIRSNVGEATVNMNWEIDVFGSIRKSAKAQKELYYASQEDYRGVMVSLVSQLSIAYISLRTYQQQLDVANRNLQSQQEILTITESRFTTGLASSLDVAQAKSLYLQTKALIPTLEVAITQQINSISVLIGEYSVDIRQQLARAAPLPVNKNIAILGLPTELIRQRPDVRSAERIMDGLASALGASRADWWPKFFVTGSFGYGSEDFKQFTDRENMTWKIGPSMTWTIFSGRQLVQAKKIAVYQLDEGINSYNKTLLTAIQEVDNALVAYNKSLLQLDADRQALEQIKLTLDLSLQLYKQGLADYQSVLDSQKNMLGFENTLASTQGRSLQSMIQLYQALGGGWEVSDEKQ